MTASPDEPPGVRDLAKGWNTNRVLREMERKAKPRSLRRRLASKKAQRRARRPRSRRARSGSADPNPGQTESEPAAAAPAATTADSEAERVAAQIANVSEKLAAGQPKTRLGAAITGDLADLGFHVKTPGRMVRDWFLTNDSLLLKLQLWGRQFRLMYLQGKLDNLLRVERRQTVPRLVRLARATERAEARGPVSQQARERKLARMALAVAIVERWGAIGVPVAKRPRVPPRFRRILAAEEQRVAREQQALLAQARADEGPIEAAGGSDEGPEAIDLTAAGRTQTVGGRPETAGAEKTPARGHRNRRRHDPGESKRRRPGSDVRDRAPAVDLAEAAN
jgi:hypothetical protein